MKLSPEEVQVLQHNLLTSSSSRPYLSWLSPLMPWIIADAGGSVGLIRGTIAAMIAHADLMSSKPGFTGDVVNRMTEFYLGDFMNSSTVKRFFSSAVVKRTASAQHLLEQVLLRHRVPSPKEGDPHYNASIELQRMVVLVQDVDPSSGLAFLSLASALARRFYYRLAFPSKLLSLPDRLRASIDEWLLLVFSTFEPSLLREQLSMGWKNFSKEGPLQHAFWRGASFCLPADVSFAAEVSRIDPIAPEQKQTSVPNTIRGTSLWCAFAS